MSSLATTQHASYVASARNPMPPTRDLTRTPGSMASDKKPDENTEIDRSTEDSSLWGHFGWEEIGADNIPYIFRQNETYCAVRMVIVELQKLFRSSLYQAVRSCTRIQSYYISETEGRLLNEINTTHCDARYGKEDFSPKDVLVRVSDVKECCQFLEVCRKKLFDCNNNLNSKCGFIRINNKKIVPYVVQDGQTFIPLLYLKEDMKKYKLKRGILEGWDLSYLKFCCKVSGIENELFANTSCAVINYSEYIVNHPHDVIEYYWPIKKVNSQYSAVPQVATSENEPKRQPHTDFKIQMPARSQVTYKQLVLPNQNSVQTLMITHIPGQRNETTRIRNKQTGQQGKKSTTILRSSVYYYSILKSKQQNQPAKQYNLQANTNHQTSQQPPPLVRIRPQTSAEDAPPAKRIRIN